MMTHKGYTGVFEYEPESEMLTGHVIGLRDQIYFEGTSLEELKQSMARAVEHYLNVCRVRSEEPDGPR